MPSPSRGSVTRPAPAPDDTAIAAILRSGEMTLDGRLIESSNAALVGRVAGDGATVRCVYKAVRGERPLWDFPDGTLARREVAAYVLARSAGWDCVPVTVFRDGPLGPGMVQQWVDGADPGGVIDVLSPAEVPAGWRPVLAAEGPDGEALVVAHADRPALQVLAAFDLVVNNADRKASHILATSDGRIRGVDHGLTLHEEPKLRTILWGWAGEPFPDPVRQGLDRLHRAWSGGLEGRLARWIAPAERAALAARLDAMRAEPVFPQPPDDRTPIPWPPL